MAPRWLAAGWNSINVRRRLGQHATMVATGEQAAGDIVYPDLVTGTVSGRVWRANVVILLLIAALALLSIDRVAERLMPPLYDDADSFIRIDPKPGWTATAIAIEATRPIGIVASGRVSTPRLTRAITSGRRPRQVGPDGANVPEQEIADWREENDFRAFALLGRVDGGAPFLVGAVGEVRTPGRLELKINCPLWDKTRTPRSGTIAMPFVKRPLTEQELSNLQQLQGFFAVRTWILGTPPPVTPHLPPTAAEITARYDQAR
jgi:hypothetical protein